MIGVREVEEQEEASLFRLTYMPQLGIEQHCILCDLHRCLPMYLCVV